MAQYMLLRNRETRQPVSYASMPVNEDFALIVREFGGPDRCEVRVWECDGSREEIHLGFKTVDGWRNAKI
jgi:hypothetical protein